MKKFFIAIVIMLGVFFLLTRVAELQEVLAVFQRGNIFFILLAFAAAVGYLVCLMMLYDTIYAMFGLQVRRRRLFQLVFASTFVNIIAPTAGLSGIAIFLADAQRMGRSKVRTTVASVLFVWFEYIGTLSILVIGFLVLFFRRDIHWSEVTAALVLLGGAAGIGLLLYLGNRSAAQLGAALAWLAEKVNRIARPFIHRDYLDIRRAHVFSQEVSDGIKALRGNNNWMLRPLMWAWLNKLALLMVLLFCFLAFKIPVDVGTLIAGLSIANLFLIVSPTPAGLGVVEGVMAVALVSLGVPIGQATVVTVVYRAATFWMTFLVGFFAFRALHLTQKQVEEQSPAERVVEFADD